jgi:hypothetical protein
VSSSDGFAHHDIGLTSDWKHDKYKERYPDGYELVWVDAPKDSADLMAAHAKHVASGADGTEWQRARTRGVASEAL